MHRFKRGEDDRGAVATEQRVPARDGTATARGADRDARGRISTATASTTARSTPRSTTATATASTTATSHRAPRPRRRRCDDRAEGGERTGGTATHGVATRDAMATARARQRDEFGGINWGASFFGWLVAVGVAALLTAILAAAGAAIGLTTTTTESELAAQPRS